MNAATITGIRHDKNEQETLAKRADEPFKRPLRLEGHTDTISLANSNGERFGYLVTVNYWQGKPVELILTTGKAGDEANADSEALGRLVSIALQYGVPAEAIIDTLRGINGGLYGNYRKQFVTSKADLIALALSSATKPGERQ